MKKKKKKEKSLQNLPLGYIVYTYAYVYMYLRMYVRNFQKAKLKVRSNEFKINIKKQTKK